MIHEISNKKIAFWSPHYIYIYILRYKFSVILKLWGHIKRRVIKEHIVFFLKKSIKAGFQNYSLICLLRPKCLQVERFKSFFLAIG